MGKKKKKYGNQMKQKGYEDQKRSDRENEMNENFILDAKFRTGLIIKRLLGEGKKQLYAYLYESLQYPMVILDDEGILNFDSAVCDLPTEPDLEKRIISEINEAFANGNDNPRIEILDYSLPEGLTYR